MQIGPHAIDYSLPARVEPVYKLLVDRRSDGWQTAVRTRVRLQAERVAWRQLLRWVQAQLAMIETGMVKGAEVFLPYMEGRDGRTFFEEFESQQLRLPAPE